MVNTYLPLEVFTLKLLFIFFIPILVTLLILLSFIFKGPTFFLLTVVFLRVLQFLPTLPPPGGGMPPFIL